MVLASLRRVSFDPLHVVLVASLMLSLLAFQGHLINRDGMLYLDMVNAILEKGSHAELSNFGSWLFFLPILVAGMSAITQLSPESCAYILNACFLAGTSVLLVAWVRRRMPEATWAACIVVLALPAYNQYRHEILREYGFWFFSMLSFWLAMQASESYRLRSAILSQLALATAALFRMEALIFMPALMLWQASVAPAGQGWRHGLIMGILPISVAIAGGLLIATGVVSVPTRLVHYLEAANPWQAVENIRQAAQKMSEAAFKFKYSREEAPYILLFGLLSVIPMKFLSMCGLFVIPLTYQLATQRNWLTRWQPLPWMWVAYMLVLAAFVIHMHFLVGRYVSMLNLLAVPVIASGFALMMQRFPRWKFLMVVLALMMMLANVVSLTPKKTYIIEAGKWLSTHAVDTRKVGVNNARIAYYAGWRLGTFQAVEWPEANTSLANGNIDFAALEVEKGMNPDIWLKENRLVELQRFSGRAGHAVIIAGRQGTPPATPR